MEVTYVYVKQSTYINVSKIDLQQMRVNLVKKQRQNVADVFC